MQSRWSTSCFKHATRSKHILDTLTNSQQAHTQYHVQCSSILQHARHASTTRVYRPLSPRIISLNFRRAASTAATDVINPPNSTRPPILNTPTRGSENIFSYLWRLASAYGTFYKTGVKAIFANRKLAQIIRQRLEKQTGAEQSLYSGNGKLLLAAIKAQSISRAEYQVLKRNAHDMMRVPVFGVLVLLLGEWLPLLVPFVPYLPPLTCRIPGQVEGMRKKTEERRRWIFRQGIQEPDIEQLKTGQYETDQTSKQSWRMADQKRSRQLIQTLRQEQLYHLSCVLNLHSRVWETVQLQPPTFITRSRVANRLAGIAQDDALLIQGGGADALVLDELLIACEERGLDVLGPSKDQLQSLLGRWLAKEKKDNGDGPALIELLFRRPAAWK